MSAPYFEQGQSNHRHLDGDRSLINIMPLLHSLTHGKTKLYPFNPWSEHQKQIARWFLADGVHKNIVSKFSITTGVMQNPISIFTAVENFVIYHGRQNLDCNFILAPQYHIFGDRYCPAGILDEKDVVDILINAIKEGRRKLREETGTANLFKLWFGIGREVSAKEALRLTGIMAECDSEYVRGISLVCHEPSNPPEKFIDAFRLAKQQGKETACHVEWIKDREESEKDTPEKIRRNFKADLPKLTKNLHTAIFDLEVTQLDHGFGLAENPELMKAVVDKGIKVTVCPGSLLATGLIDSFEMLGIDKLLKAGVRVSFDVDDDICMPNIDEIFRMYKEEYCQSASAEKLDCFEKNVMSLILNSY